MRGPDPIIVTADFKTLVSAMEQRLGRTVAVVAPRWRAFADALQLASVDPQSLPGPTSNTTSSIVVGPLAFVLKHAVDSRDEFGFVIPEAQLAKPWQRVTQWRDNATLELWRAGWSPAAVDRMVLATHDAQLEFVIGNARPTPG